MRTAENKLLTGLPAILTLLIFLFFYFNVTSQNLVPNPDFESFGACPLGPSELNNLDFWNNPQDSSTPDFHHACSPLNIVSVPNNVLGSQFARSGDGYAGFIAYEDDGFLGCPSFLPSGWREYMQVGLNTPLVAGATYLVKFYVSLGDDVKYATDEIGMYFSPTQTNLAGPTTALPFTPQVVNTGGFITDTSNWILISDCYLATGGEAYIIIGNFNNDANTNVLCVNPNALINPFAYYYVDDVSIELISNCCVVEYNTQSTSETCSAGDGSATVNITAGESPFTYSWSTGDSSATITGLSAGEYHVTVTESNGCSDSTTITVSSDNNMLVSIGSTNANCGSCDGEATATASGGTGSILYIWDTDASSQTTQTATGLCPGSYQVTLTDANGCLTTGTAFIGGGGGGISATISVTDAECLGSCNGTGTISPSGGTSPYAYQWDAAAGSQVTATATGLCAGTYFVTVTDANSGGGATEFWTEDFGTGCDQGNLANSYSGSNGAWVVSSTGTNDSESNKWYVSATAAGMGAGNCGDGCLDNGALNNRTLHIAENFLLNIDEDANYNTGTGFICIFPIPCVNSNWRAESPVINCSGQSDISLEFNYLEGGDGTTDNATVWYYNGTTWSQLVDPPKTATTCGSNGLWTAYSIALPSSANNNPNVKIGFNWTNDDDGDGSDPSFAVDDIVLRNNDTSSICPLISTVTIDAPDAFNISLSSTPENCLQGDGTATLAVTGGTPPYSYLWQDGQTDTTATGLSEGIFRITVTDSSGCIASDSTLILPFILNVAVTGFDARCFGDCKGKASINVINGTPPYTYLWDNNATGPSLNAICAGQYVVTITDANGCTTVDTAHVDEPDLIIVDISQTNASCYGQCDGTATIDTIIGGVPPFILLWSSGGAGTSVNGLCAGPEILSVTDATGGLGRGCLVFDSIYINEPDSMSLTVQLDDSTCFNTCEGAITITSASAGFPIIDYSWSNGDNGLTADSLCAGNQTVTATDNAGCTYTEDFTIIGTVDECEGTMLRLKVFLEGPYSSTNVSMNDVLRTSGYIPLEEPYTTLGFAHLLPGGGEIVDSAVLSITGNNAIVDWVYVELRDKNDNTSVLYTRAALVQSDGDIVDTDGVSDLFFQGTPSDDYFIVVRHRNHLGAMTLNTHYLNGPAYAFDFTDTSSQVYGLEAQKRIGNINVLWAGNAYIDGFLRYSGMNNDRDPILVIIGGSVPTAVATGYHTEDVNLDGVVRYSGMNNDRDVILVNIGGSVPTAVRTQQLP